MQLSFFDYLVIVIVYIFVSMRGDKVMKFISFDKISAMLPMNKASSSVIIHAIFFAIVLALVNVVSSKIAGYNDDCQCGN